MTRKSYPGGAAPYSAALLSLSVPSTPTRRTFTNTPRPFGTWSTEGFGRSATWTLLGFPGNTLIAFISILLMNSVCGYLSNRRFGFLAVAGLSALLHQLGDHTGPSGLMAGSYSGTRVAVEILMKQDQVTPV